MVTPSSHPVQTGFGLAVIEPAVLKGNPMSTTVSDTSSEQQVPPCQLQPHRRGFLKKAVAIVTAAATAAIPLMIGMTYFLTPLWKRKQDTGSGDGFRFVGKVGGLTPGGPPQLFQVVGVKQDAWTTYPGTSLGSVFVRMKEDGSLLCFNARCTHLGCTVGYQSSRNEFYCPCHTASFSLDGERTNQVPPRNLDGLQAEIRNKDEIWVHFQDFRGGTAEKIPI